MALATLSAFKAFISPKQGYRVPTKSISAQQSRQMAINRTLRCPNSQNLLRPVTASIRSLEPPHFRQVQIKSVIGVFLGEKIHYGGQGSARTHKNPKV